MNSYKIQQLDIITDPKIQTVVYVARRRIRLTFSLPVSCFLTLSDGDEVLAGTYPLDSNSDDDGPPDRSDAEFIQNVVDGLDDEDFKRRDHRTAIISILDDVEYYLSIGETDQAIISSKTFNDT